MTSHITLKRRGRGRYATPDKTYQVNFIDGVWLVHWGTAKRLTLKSALHAAPTLARATIHIRNRRNDLRQPDRT